MFAKIWRAIKTAAAVAALAVATYAAFEVDAYNRQHTIPERITFHPGGGVIEHYELFTEMRKIGKPVVVDGFCVSACTMVLGLIPQDKLCVTPYARFAFHSASLIHVLTGERVGHAKVGTEIVWMTYPEPVRAMLRQKGWDGMSPDKAEHPDLIYLEGAELLKLVRACN